MLLYILCLVVGMYVCLLATKQADSWKVKIYGGKIMSRDRMNARKNSKMNRFILGLVKTKLWTTLLSALSINFFLLNNEWFSSKAQALEITNPSNQTIYISQNDNAKSPSSLQSDSETLQDSSSFQKQSIWNVVGTLAAVTAALTGLIGLYQSWGTSQQVKNLQHSLNRNINNTAYLPDMLETLKEIPQKISSIIEKEEDQEKKQELRKIKESLEDDIETLTNYLHKANISRDLHASAQKILKRKEEDLTNKVVDHIFSDSTLKVPNLEHTKELFRKHIREVIEVISDILTLNHVEERYKILDETNEYIQKNKALSKDTYEEAIQYIIERGLSILDDSEKKKVEKYFKYIKKRINSW